MYKNMMATGLALVLSTTATADFLGFTVGAYGWDADYDGSVQSGPDTIDLDDQLGFDDETHNTVFVSFEHPVPALPNVALAYTELDADARGALTGEVFDNVAYTGPVKTTLDLSHTDLTLYYELLDNWVSVDLGLTIRKFDDGIKIRDTLGNSSDEDLDEVLPMLYLAAKFELPLSGLYASADANMLSYDDSDLIDYKVNIGYETSLGLGAELGYRYFDLDYEDASDESADITIDGLYAGVFYHF